MSNFYTSSKYMVKSLMLPTFSLLDKFTQPSCVQFYPVIHLAGGHCIPTYPKEADMFLNSFQCQYSKWTLIGLAKLCSCHSLEKFKLEM